MKPEVIKTIVKGILTVPADEKQKARVANEAVIYWKTFRIAESDVAEAMEYFTGTHTEEEYKEFV